MRKMFILGLVLTALLASAHEVYVLTPAAINTDLAAPPLNLYKIALSEMSLFLLSGFVTLLILGISFSITISNWFGQRVGYRFQKLAKYTPYIAQITLGLALFASGYERGVFGPEIPFSMIFGSFQVVAGYIFMLGGLLMLGGIAVRQVSTSVFVLFLWLVMKEGTYMFNYGVYAVEAALLTFFGGEYGFDKKMVLPSWLTRLGCYRYLFLRVGFGVSLLYAAFYAKWIHGALALDTVISYHLTNYFPFDPPFVVLGAFIVETMIALFFIFGFHTRFTALLYFGFLVASVLFFKEAVWPHIILFGTTLAVFTHGYDRYCVDSRFKKYQTEV